MKQESQRLIPQSDLSALFPDIEGQLCSRHSTLFGKLKVQFNKLYQTMDPSHYVVIKGISNIVQTDQVSLSMALQNGMILLVRKTYPNSKFFINGNHIDEEIILQQNGKLSEGLHEWTQQIETVFQSALDDQPLNQLSGGIIYLHSNIPQKFFQYKKIMLMSLFIGAMVINENLNKYNIEELIQKMVQTKVMGDFEFIEQQFKKYENRELNLKVGENSFSIPFEDDLKLVFCRLDLALHDINYQKERKQELKERKNKIIEWLKQKHNVDSFYQAFEEQLEVQLPDGSEQELMKEMINQQMKELSMVCDFSNKSITFRQLIENKWNFDKNVWKIFSEEVEDLVQEIKQQSKIETCLIIHNEFLLIPVAKKSFAELICHLRQLCHRGQLKSKSLFKIEEQLIEHRWGSDKQIGQKIFASVPSKGVGVFDPTQSMWFY